MKDILHITNSALDYLQKLQKFEVIKSDSETENIFIKLRSELEEMQEKSELLIKENSGYKVEIKKLQAQISGEHGLSVKNNVYYTPGGDGPFCPLCYEKRGKKIRLRRDESVDDLIVPHVCRVCEQSFND